MAGTLFICGTPIGNLGDASPRLRQTLDSVDQIYAEDTRRSRKLLQALGVEAPLRSYFVGNEAARSRELARHLEDGHDVALITDAGMPSVSDPGVSAVKAATRIGATVSVIPGPSAVTAALAVSGLSAERFVFEGFLPRKGSIRANRLKQLAGEERTVILFVTAGRAAADLAGLAEVCGAERLVVIGRELSKLHEQVWRGSLGEARLMYEAAAPRGELTLVLEGASPPGEDLAAAVAQVESHVEEGASFSDAVREVAADHNIGRGRLYELARGRPPRDH